MESKITLDSEVLWISPNNKWSIEKINGYELAISDGWEVCYAYISRDKSTLMVDRVIYPMYVQNKAIELARSNIESIYK